MDRRDYIKAKLKEVSCTGCYWCGSSLFNGSDGKQYYVCTNDSGKLKLANKICSEYELIRDKKLKKEYEKFRNEKSEY
jgi:hypothetical protein